MDRSSLTFVFTLLWVLGLGTVAIILGVLAHQAHPGPFWSLDYSAESFTLSAMSGIAAGLAMAPVVSYLTDRRRC